jgi:hypothetical protein
MYDDLAFNNTKFNLGGREPGSPHVIAVLNIKAESGERCTKCLDDRADFVILI